VTSSREPWRENSLSTSLLIVAILIAGMLAGWAGYERSSSPPTVDLRAQEAAQPCGAGS